MQRNKQPIPRPRQPNRQAILSQGTTATENRDQANIEQKDSDTTNTSTREGGHGQPIEPLSRDMFPKAGPILRWDKIGVYVAAFLIILIALIPVVWYLASQDATVRTLTDDTKDLKKRSEETTRFTIESGIRLSNVEHRLTGVEQRESGTTQRNGPATPPVPKAATDQTPGTNSKAPK